MDGLSRLYGYRSRRVFSGGHYYLVVALLVLVVFWMICFILLTTHWQSSYVQLSSFHSGPLSSSLRATGKDQSQEQHNEKPPIQYSHILSRSGKVVATSDVRGNLGPASVVVQPKPGDDWLHDRWQAASDMHGKNIPGEHWIQLQFPSKIFVDSIVLDWETAYASDYLIEGSMEPITDANSNTEKVWILFDGTDPSQQSIRSESKSGQSPGVKQKMPLHVVHTLSVKDKKPLQYLRLHILKSVTGWGVSLWEFDVYGFLESESILS
jgi:hypothetical protein